MWVAIAIAIGLGVLLDRLIVAWRRTPAAATTADRPTDRRPAGARSFPPPTGSSVAVHDLAGMAGPDHPLLLVAHATGFHGWAYQPLAAHLAPPFHVVAADLRGHGDTPPPPAWEVAWVDYGDDATAVADRLGAEPGGERGLVAFGHSMGGAALLMAAARRPERFPGAGAVRADRLPRRRAPARRRPERPGGRRPAAADHVPLVRGGDRQLRRPSRRSLPSIPTPSRPTYATGSVPTPTASG